MPNSRLFGEESKANAVPSEPCYTWGVGVLISALNAAAKVDSRYLVVLEQTIEATRSYWNTDGPVPGYDVHPMPKPMDRYYDDNEWMVLALLESNKLTGDKAYLNYAKETFNYVLSGLDSKLGGGVYWRETEKSSKNTCSNGPAAAAALGLYDATKDAAYLKTAVDIYSWTKAHLRDPADGLYWDNINLSGKVEKTKWSYNTALMLRTATELYRFTKRQGYADDACEMQKSSLAKWVAPSGSLRDDGKFVHLLLENWIRAFRVVPGAADPTSAIETGLTRLHDLSRDSLGHYGNRWDKTPVDGPYSPFKLIDQASAARAFLIASEK
jgi:uncharacterized protein YyaL (SSP411 family)